MPNKLHLVAKYKTKNNDVTEGGLKSSPGLCV